MNFCDAVGQSAPVAHVSRQLRGIPPAIHVGLTNTPEPFASGRLYKCTNADHGYVGPMVGRH
jgi:hypothetical protein